MTSREETSQIEPLEPVAPSAPSVVKGIWRVLYILAGLGFVGLAILGTFLPILPSTPFLLLASYFFIRSSPALNGWLLRNRIFGPLLRDWQRYRGVRRSVKLMAVSVLCVAVLTSVLLANLSWPFVVILLLLGLIGLVVVLRLPVVKEDHRP
jgi:uncharacterized membrane protein YbaN (DUF454 family)